MTGKEMCERCAAELERRYGVKVDPEEIWNCSPSGELYPVVELFWSLFPGEAPEPLRSYLLADEQPAQPESDG